MPPIKLCDSELNVMELIWEHGTMTAKDLAILAEKEIGWNKNTTYTVLKQLVRKKAIQRDEPNFMCSALITKENIQKNETNNLIDKFFCGSKKLFMSAFLTDHELSEIEIEELRKLLEKSAEQSKEMYKPHFF